MELPSCQHLPLGGKKVLLRADYDVPLRLNREWVVADETRLENSLPTIKYLLKQKAQIIILAHLGRPEGKRVVDLSLEPVRKCLERLLKKPVILAEEINRAAKNNSQIVLLENLRFWPQEEKNDVQFAKDLASLGEFYINESWAVSHRKHTSIVSLPIQFAVGQRAFGLLFIKEFSVLSKVRQSPARPVALILGGIKKDKLLAVKNLASWADWILVGGKLVKYQPDFETKTVIGELTKDGLDITPETVEKFVKIITGAKTVIWAGPLGYIYDEEHALGTKMVAQAVVQSQARSIIGGGDTEEDLTRFGLVKKIDFISSGGGAMLEFLAQGTLPGIEAVING